MNSKIHLEFAHRILYSASNIPAVSINHAHTYTHTQHTRMWCVGTFSRAEQSSRYLSKALAISFRVGSRACVYVLICSYA